MLFPLLTVENMYKSRSFANRDAQFSDFYKKLDETLKKYGEKDYPSELRTKQSTDSFLIGQISIQERILI